MNKNFRLVTDATADLPLDIIEQNDISVIPMECCLGEQHFLYEPTGQGFSLKEFYDKMREDVSTSTSQINLFTYTDFFKSILEDGKDIFYLAFSSGLTGSQQSALIAIEDLKTQYPNRRIVMVDTLCACLGEGLIVYLAAQKIKEGMDIDALAQWATDIVPRICHWFTVDDLKYLVKGGRLSSTSAFFGQALRIKPVLHVDDVGHLVALNKVQGRKRSLKGLVDLMEEQFVKGETDIAFIGHADCPEDAEYVRDLIKERMGIKSFIIGYISPIIGAHSGPGTVALFHVGTHR